MKKNNKKSIKPGIQDREPNFRSISGQLFLVKCFVCDPTFGKENYTFAVANGECAWCQWREK